MNLDQLYEQTIKPLSTADRLRLATLILNNILPDSAIDNSEEWTEEDYRDFNTAGWKICSTAENTWKFSE